MSYLGPKSVNEKGDSINYKIPDHDFYTETDKELSSRNLPNVYAIVFIDDKNRSDNYKIKGIIEYFHLKQKDIEEIDLFLAYSSDQKIDFRDSLKLQNKRVAFLRFPIEKKTEYLKHYFPNEGTESLPFFVAMIDENKNIRGYYNGNLVAEVKKMIQEFKHLKLKESRKQLQNENKLEQIRKN
jgi:hypothetical protein